MFSDKVAKIADKVNKTESAKKFADLVAALSALPASAHGDPKAAAEMGKEVAKGAASSLKAEADAASAMYGETQTTYRHLIEKAESPDERERIREDARQSEERAESFARYRSDSSERIWMSAIKVVGVVAVGIAGLTLAGAAYALSNRS